MTSREKELTINKLKDILTKFKKGGKLGIVNQTIELNEYDYWAIDMAIKALEQEPRKGHWIEVLGGCKCSCCDMAFSRLKETCADNYCPNCGSDNREVKE